MYVLVSFNVVVIGLPEIKFQPGIDSVQQVVDRHKDHIIHRINAGILRGAKDGKDDHIGGRKNGPGDFRHYKRSPILQLSVAGIVVIRYPPIFGVHIDFIDEQPDDRHQKKAELHIDDIDAGSRQYDLDGIAEDFIDQVNIGINILPAVYH